LGEVVRFAFWNRRRAPAEESERPRPLLIACLTAAVALAGASGYLAYDRLPSIARTPTGYAAAVEAKRGQPATTVSGRLPAEGAATRMQPPPLAMFRSCVYSGQTNCVIDGDTIRLAGIKIRLADIDAPEVFSPKCRAEAELGQRATSRLIDLLNAGPVTLATDSSGRDQDDFGRKLRIVARDGRSLGDMLVREGLAQRWNDPRRNWCG